MTGFEKLCKIKNA